MSSSGALKQLKEIAVNGIFKMYKTELFVTKTVGQLLSGYKDPLMAMAKKLLPKVVKEDTFSLLNGVRKHFEIHNGVLLLCNKYLSFIK